MGIPPTVAVLPATPCVHVLGGTEGHFRNALEAVLVCSLKNENNRDLPDALVAKILYLQCRGCGLENWLEN